MSARMSTIALVVAAVSAIFAVPYPPPALAQVEDSPVRSKQVRERDATKPPRAPQALPPPAPKDTAKSKKVIDKDGSERLPQLQDRILLIHVPPGVQPPIKLFDRAAFASTHFQGFARFVCTLTAIGPRVLLTAAHCTEGFDQGDLVLLVPQHPRELIGPARPAVVPRDGDNQGRGAKVPDDAVVIPAERLYLRMTCTPHPRYARTGAGILFDWSLCRLSEDFPGWVLVNNSTLLAPVRLERLSLQAADSVPRHWAQDARKVVLTGFGCQTPREEPAGTWGAGYAILNHIGPVRMVTGSPFRRDSSILCKGDSGGAAYRLDEKDPAKRVIVAVNSMNLLATRQSFLARTSAPAFVSFFNSWRATNGYPFVCGVDKTEEPRCR